LEFVNETGLVTERFTVTDRGGAAAAMMDDDGDYRWRLPMATYYTLRFMILKQDAYIRPHPRVCLGHGPEWLSDIVHDTGALQHLVPSSCRFHQEHIITYLYHYRERH
jgi:hypothetical protein